MARLKYLNARDGSTLFTQDFGRIGEQDFFYNLEATKIGVIYLVNGVEKTIRIYSNADDNTAEINTIPTLSNWMLIVLLLGIIITGVVSLKPLILDLQ